MINFYMSYHRKTKTLESIGLPQGVYAYELEKLESNDYTFLNRIIIKIENFLFFN